MKFTIESREFAQGLSRIIGTVPKRSHMPILANIKVVVDGLQLRLIATDMNSTTETLVNATIEEGGDGFLIPAQRLYDTVAALSDSTLKVSISDGFRATILTENAKYQIMGLDASEYPITTDTSEPSATLVLPTGRVRALVDAVSYATSSDEFRPAMAGVLLQVRPTELRVVATDGFRLATRKEIFSEPISEMEIDVILSPDPVKVALKHISEANVTIQLRSQHVVFSDSVTTFTMRLVDEKYPNWMSVLPTKNDNILILRRDELLATLKRVSLYSNFQTKQVRFNLLGSFDESTLLVQADDIETGSEAKESMPMQYGGEKMELGLNGAFLKETLNHISSDEVEIRMATPLRPLLFYPAKQADDNEYFHLLMPVRLNS